LDTAVTPPGILPGQSEHEALRFRLDARAPGRPVRSGPLPFHQLTVPPQERLRADHERVPCFAREQPAHRGQEHPIRFPVHGALDLPSEDGDLVAKDRDLELHPSACALVRLDETEHSAQEEIEERLEHGGALSQKVPRRQSQARLRLWTHGVAA